MLRYLYDKKYAFLGLKKINEIIPHDQYQLLETAYTHLGENGFQKSNECLIRVLEIFVSNAGDSLRNKLNMRLFDWIKGSLGCLLFPKMSEDACHKCVRKGK